MSVTLSNTPVLETERLILRAPEATDWPAWRAMIASERSKFIRHPDADEGQAWRGMGHLIGHWVLRGWGLFVITRKGDDQGIGAVGPYFPAMWPEKELGWSIWHEDHEGRGYVTEAVAATRDYAYQTLGWTTAVSYIHPENHGSVAVAKRLGAVLDKDAAFPGDGPCDVYRHPSAEALA